MANENGIIVVMAAGNEGAAMNGFRTNDILRYVNDYDNMIVASALKPESSIEFYDFSNHAGSVEHNHFAVVEDYSHAYSTSGEYDKNINGTSFAAPYLSGAVALIIQKLRDEGKYDFEGDYKQVIELLKSSSSFEIEISKVEPIVEEITLSSSSITVFDAVHDYDYGEQYVTLIVEENDPISLISMKDLDRRSNSFEIKIQEKILWIRNFEGEIHLPGNLIIKHEYDPIVEDAIEIIFTINPNLLENVNSPDSESVSLIGRVISLLENSDNIALEIANMLHEGNVKKLLQHQANVVYGISPEESDEIIDDLILSGKFTESSLFEFITDSAAVEAEIDSGNLGSFGNSSWVLYQDFDM